MQAPAGRSQTPVIALVVAGMNDVLNSQGYTQAAWWNRIPVAAWGLLDLIAVCCNLLVGYGAHGAGDKGRPASVLPLVVSISFLLIADIDSPRDGLIHVAPAKPRCLVRVLAQVIVCRGSIGRGANCLDAVGTVFSERDNDEQRQNGRSGSHEHRKAALPTSTACGCII